MLLAIVTTIAVLTMMTSSIGVGIFSQHANAAKTNNNGATQVKGATCTIIGGPMFGGHTTVTTNEMHAVITPASSGQVNLNCHS